MRCSYPITLFHTQELDIAWDLISIGDPGHASFSDWAVGHDAEVDLTLVCDIDRTVRWRERNGRKIRARWDEESGWEEI